jgi:acyl-CoA thioesterase YciA
VARIGRSSITIDLETVVQRRHDSAEIRVTHGTFVFVAIDQEGRPRQVAQEACV